jgi:phytol kinase
MNEIYRQSIHLIYGLTGAAVILYADRQLALYLFTAVLFIGFIVLEIFIRGYSPPVLTPVMDEVDRKGSIPAKGGLAFIMSGLFCLVFFPPVFAAAALIALGVHDSVSTLVGIRFGKIHIYKKKTLAGAVSGIAATVVVLLLLLEPFTAVVVAFVAGIVEMFSPIDDNLTIPVAVCLLLTAMAVL